VRRLLIILAGAVLLVLGMAVPAHAVTTIVPRVSGELPAGSTACTDWVLSSEGVYLRARADNVPATFTTRMSTTLGGPETTIFSQTTREVQTPQLPGNDYPTLRVLVTPPTPGTYFLRNCVTASQGSAYRYIINTEGNGPGQADVGSHQATLTPGGRLCGDWLPGPAIGLGDGVARLTGTANTPVRFSITATDTDYAFLGEVFGTTGTDVAPTYVAPSYISSLSACVTNTSTTVATVAFELSAT